MKWILNIILFFLLMQGCHRNNKVTIELFNPNPLLTPNDVYNLNIPRVLGEDVDMFEIISADTTIWIETGENIVFAQGWFISIDSTTTLDEVEFFFKNQYDVITLSRDTIIGTNEEIKIKAYSKKNNLHFQYDIIDLNDRRCDRKNIVVSVYYRFPEYEKYLNKP
jgi:hypothetical protein